MKVKFIYDEKSSGHKVANKHRQLSRVYLGVIKIIRRKKFGIKLLGNGELKAKVTISVNWASKVAVEAIEKAGGKIEII